MSEKGFTALQAACATHHAALVKGYVTAGFESEFLPCIRVAFTGVRFVAAVSLEGLRDWATTTDGADGAGGKLAVDAAAVTADWYKHVMQSINKDTLTQLCASTNVYAGSLGPHDMLYMPAGWLVYERSLNMSDVVGLRTSIVPKKDAKATAFLEGLSNKSKVVSEALELLKAA